MANRRRKINLENYKHMVGKYYYNNRIHSAVKVEDIYVEGELHGMPPSLWCSVKTYNDKGNYHFYLDNLENETTESEWILSSIQ